MAETTAAKPAGSTTTTDQGAQVAAAPAEQEHQAVAVVEVTLTRAVESGADHRRTADQFSADLAQATGDEWQEASRRVKSVRVTQAQ